MCPLEQGLKGRREGSTTLPSPVHDFLFGMRVSSFPQPIQLEKSQASTVLSLQAPHCGPSPGSCHQTQFTVKDKLTVSQSDLQPDVFTLEGVG